MRLASVDLARSIVFVSLEDILPRRRIFYPDFVKLVVDQFKFQKSPQGLYELDLPQGASFEHGKVGDIVVEKLSIYRNGFVVDTSSSTADSEIALQQILLWAVETLGINYRQEKVTRRSYYSQLVVYFELSLDVLNPALSTLCKQVSDMVTKQFGQPMQYETYGVTISIDPTSTKLQPGGFSIEKRKDVPFSEEKYFSGAPLQTEDHLKLLEEFESALKT